MTILIELLEDADGYVRCDAAEALMRIDPGRGTECILPLLADPDSSIRWNTCGLLYDFGDARATQRLIEIVEHDPAADVRLFAADALGNIGDPSALPALRRAMELDAGCDWEGRRVSASAREAIESIERRNA